MEPHFRYTEKSVVIHRDESGFGFRVGGQNPVIVDCVHENGAAWKAGVRKKDHIIKVNGTLVRSYGHKEVVKMIQNCTKFVNLTLHSPEPVAPFIETFTVPSGINNNFSGSQQNIDTLTNNSNNNLSSNANNIKTNNNATVSSTNTNVINNLVMTSNKKSHNHSPIHQRFNNLNWLAEIGDDLFQDNLHQQQTIDNNIANAHQPATGVSKLVETGPTTLNTSNTESSFTGGVRPKIRQNRNQSSTRDNPYYYYKSAPEKSGLETNCESANLTCSNQDPHHHHNLHQPSSSTSTTGKSFSSIVRSRSSGKIRSSSSSKHKSRKLGSRIVGDFRSLTMTNNQPNSSSLSTSPSSSDLSDCDDTDDNRPVILLANTSTSSIGGSTSTNSIIPSDPNSSNFPNSSNSQTVIIPETRLSTRRLEIIRELVDTEKTHTERLKHLNDLLYKPIKAEGLVPMEQLKMIFSCHKTLFKIHRQIFKILLAAQKNVSEDNQDQLIGRALVEIFEGELGQRLEKAASAFCACQSINTELLNRFTRKDTKAGEFLAQVANQQMLGRLGIKDLLASCFQRLTKYPLLLDNLLKATPDTCPEERLFINRALVTSRQILTHVNDAVKREMSHNRLRDLWKKTDKPSTLSNIDIANQHIIHEGPLTLRLNRRSFEVYAMLLTQYLVIFTREGPEKLKLKYWTIEGKVTNQQLSPILNIDEHLATRDTATDENGFYLLCKNKIDLRIYQFATQSPSERARWKEKIHMVQQYNYPVAAEDDNTLTRYRELIPLATSSNTPNNIEQHSQPTS